MKRTTKSIIAFVVLVAMCVSFCVPAFAEAAHEHNNNDTQPTETTCPLKGQTHKLEYLGLTPETAKDYVVKEVPAPCKGRGYTLYQCPDCDVKFADNWVDGEQTDHVFDEENVDRKAPTCTQPGYEKFTCINCKTVVEATLEPTEHQFSDWVIYKDGVVVDTYLCTDTGVVKMRECTVCENEEGRVEIEEINAAEHVIEESWVYPTCQTKGTVTYDCTKCDYIKVVDAYVDINNLPADYHTNIKYDAEKADAPTCGSEGLARDAVCLACGATGDFKLPKVSHNWTEEAAKAPTCNEDGNLKYYYCAYDNCGVLSFDKVTTVEAEDVVDPKLDHKNKTKVDAESASNTCYPGVAPIDGYVAGTLVPIANAVVLTDANKGWGVNVYVCPDCDNAKYVEYVAPKAHNNLGIHREEPTHTSWGFTGTICLDCGYFDKDTMTMLPPYTHIVESVDSVPANMKKVDDATLGYREPSCGVTGIYVYECQVCKEAGEANRYTTLTIDAIGHTYEEKVVNPTCKENGWTWKICSCGDVQKPNAESDGKYNHVTIAEYMVAIDYANLDPANDEDYAILCAFHNTTETEKTVTTAPTCTTNGWSRTFCVDCSWYAERQDVAKLDHPEANRIPGSLVEVGCENDGGFNWECGLCGAPGFTKTADKLGHVYYENGLAEQFDETNNRYYKLVDGEKVYLGTRVAVVAPTCTEGGYTTIACGNECGKTEKLLPTAKLGHSWAADDFVATRPDPEDTMATADYSYIVYPTCDGAVKNGSWVFICQNENCSEKTAIAIEDVNDPDYDFDFHNPSHHIDAEKLDVGFREPTCNVSGIEKWYCHACYVRNGETTDEFGVTSGTFDVVLEELSCEDYKINVLIRVDETCFAAGRYAAFECEKCHTKYYYDHKNGNELKVYTNDEDIVIAQRTHTYAVDDTCAEGNPCTQTGCTYVKPALAHTLTPVDAKAPTCTSIGWEAYEYCSKCEYTTYVEKPVVDHNVKAGEPVLPTCTTPGYTYYACTTCDTQDYIDAYKPAKGHSYADVADKVVEPTCTEDGYEEYLCLVCGEDGKKTIKLECEYGYVHMNKNNVAFIDICVAGVDDYFCVQCEETIAVKHADAEVLYDSEDCTKYVYEIHICPVCFYHEEKAIDKKEQHELGEWRETVSPTLTTLGKARRDCMFCDYYEEKDVASNAGVQFDFAITNLVGAVEKDGYAGRIKLVIDLTAKDIFASNVALNIAFDKNVVNFVSGELTSVDFTGDALTFTNSEIANKNGYVVVSAASQTGDVELTNGQFAVLYFDINVDAIGKDVVFSVNENVVEGSNATASGVANVKGEKIEAMYTAIETVKTTRFGDLTPIANDDIVTLDDAAALLKMIMEEIEYCSEADLNKDGYITVEDYAIIRSLLIGNIESLG